MKPIVFRAAAAALALIALASCASSASKFIQTSYFTDYWTAGLEGKVFLTESNSVSFDYTPIGSILIEEIAGEYKVSVAVDDKTAFRRADPVYNDIESSREKKTYRFPSYSSALRRASEEALKMGGDGIINIKASSSNYGRQSMLVSGMVIKRKN